MKKFSFSVIVLALLLLSSFGSAANSAFYQLNVSSSSYTPSTIYAGNEVSIAVSIYNKSTAGASDVLLTLEPGHYFDEVDVIKTIDRIDAKDTKTVAFKVQALDNVPAGAYNFSLKLEYGEGDGKVTEYQAIVVTVSEIYRVAVENLGVSDYYPHIGDTVKIKANVKNTGSIQARNVTGELSLIGADDFGKFIVISDTVKEAQGILPGANLELEFEVKPSEKIEPGVYSFKITGNCLDCDSSASEKFALHVYGRPELFISSIDYSIKGRDTKDLMQGDNFSFSIQLDNEGKESVKKLIIEIMPGDSLAGSVKSYVGSIDADDSSAGLFDLMVKPDAAVGDHSIGIKISYEDEMGKLQSIEDSFTVSTKAMPEASPLIPYVLVIVVLVLLYFIIKMIFRQLQIRKL